MSMKRSELLITWMWWSRWSYTQNINYMLAVHYGSDPLLIWW